MSRRGLMKKCLIIWLLLPAQLCWAQRVLYSPFFDANPATRHYQMAGKTGPNYWTIREKKTAYGRSATDAVFEGYDIYDDQLEKLRSIDRVDAGSDVRKTYFVSGKSFFDEFMVCDAPNHSVFRVTRYEADGSILWPRKAIDSIPFHESANSFLLLRSENQSRILLLAFEHPYFSNPRIHAMLFDGDWNQLYSRIYTHEWLTQPMIQFEDYNFPVEPFSNSPVKLTNDGDWVMVSPSRTNQNYLLFHFGKKDSSFTWQELKVSPSASVEEIGISIDNESREVSTGILCKLRYPTLKSVSLARYNMAERKLVFDSSFRFNTVSGGKVRNENLVQENFVSLPGGGFVLLKEYGRPYRSSLDSESEFEDQLTTERLTDPIFSTPGTLQPVNRDGYTRFNNLAGPANKYERGDLSLFYFPVGSADSIWSGIINKEQVTELNSSYLSYLAIPYQDRLFLVYNSYFRNEAQYGSTTILDRQGHPVDDGGVIFWKIRNTLLFQRARQISRGEVMVPYTRNRSEGFAVIRF